MVTYRNFVKDRKRMNYKYHYEELIRKYGRCEKPEGVYTEGHHILPKSMGGSNESKNIVYLTAREHYLAHFLLWKLHENSQMTYAFRLMNAKSGLLGNREFSRLRGSYSKCCSEKLAGRKNTSEQMEKQTQKVIAYYKRIGSKGKPKLKGVWSDESREAQSDRMKKSHHLAKIVIVDGYEFHSLRAAATNFGVSHRTVKRWFSTGRAFYKIAKD
jgi:hypothetical protein